MGYVWHHADIFYRFMRRFKQGRKIHSAGKVRKDMDDSIQKLKKIYKSPALVKVFGWSRCVHSKILLICILRVISVFCSLGITLVTKELIDAAIASHMDKLWYYGVLLLVLTLIVIGIGFLLSLLQTYASAKLERSLHRMIAEALLNKTYANLRGYHSGELINRFFSDGSVVCDGALGILPGIVSLLVSFLGAASILIVLDWQFVILLACAGVIGLVIVIMFRNPMKKRHKRMQKAEDRLYSVVQETFENIRLIKASISEKRILKQIGMRQSAMEEEQIRQGKFSAVMNNSMGMIFDLSWLICMLWGCTAIYHGELTYGSLAAMIQLIGRVQGPIAGAVSIAGEAYRVISSAERIMEVTDLPEEEPGEPLSDFDEILMKNVSFRYDDGVEDVLSGVSCSIQKGDFVALTGMSGGGKTSLFYLLLGIYMPNTGEVLFRCGSDEIHAGSGTRKLFAYVPQGNTLFSGTLRENLTMFTDEATEEEIQNAIQAACIDDLISEIGLDAEIGERGAGLSEGQAQRIAVARALLMRAPILLLDESTSALDEETEGSMLKNISKMRDKTCLIVTHRKAALSICDYRLHIEDGYITRETTKL